MAMRAYGFRPWITLHGFGGLTSHAPSGSYHSAGYSSLGQILITAAGPVAGFLLATLVVLLLRITGHIVVVEPVLRFIPLPITGGVGAPAMTVFVNDLLAVSVIWGALNLLPVYPLDGGQIAREVLLRVDQRDGIRRSLILSMVTGAAVAIIAAMRWNDLYMALLFAYLAYSSYVALQSYMGRGPF